MKVLSLHQPWASLIAMSVKTIETRSWRAPQSLIGERIAIHAAKKQPSYGLRLGPWDVMGGYGEDWELRRLGSVDNGHLVPDRHERGLAYRLPLGAIVATARLASCLPMLNDGGDEEGPRCVELRAVGTSLARIPLRWGSRDVTDQLPYGDFRPGRWAWILDDIEPLAEPELFKGGQGLSRSWEPRVVTETTEVV